MKRGTTSFRVRYGETDQMGLAYHPNYLVWCEIGRTEYMRELGVPYAELERQGIFLAVADASVRYGAAAHYDDHVRVETWVDSVKSRTITFGYEIHRTEPDPARLARATTTLVCIDGDGRTRRLPDTVRELFGP
ncbi:MAG: thioesterase family protein [Longimicrobiales bacterium]|nr:thioesterase family protein [Longimicrobiales bacterium]